MSTQSMTREELVKLVTQRVVEALKAGPPIPLGVSNRHIHLDRSDMDALFGPGSELTFKKELAQPGQYAAEETVIIRGPKGELKRVRVLGPLRSATQVEISVADGYVLGVKPPVRESGKLDNTPGVEIIGPCGAVKKDAGAIVALRHIHMSPEDALRFGDLVKALGLFEDRIAHESVAYDHVGDIARKEMLGFDVAQKTCHVLFLFTLL